MAVLRKVKKCSLAEKAFWGLISACSLLCFIGGGLILAHYTHSTQGKCLVSRAWNQNNQTVEFQLQKQAFLVRRPYLSIKGIFAPIKKYRLDENLTCTYSPSTQIFCPSTKFLCSLFVRNGTYFWIISVSLFALILISLSWCCYRRKTKTPNYHYYQPIPQDPPATAGPPPLTDLPPPPPYQFPHPPPPPAYPEGNWNYPPSRTSTTPSPELPGAIELREEEPESQPQKYGDYFLDGVQIYDQNFFIPQKGPENQSLMED